MTDTNMEDTSRVEDDIPDESGNAEMDDDIPDKSGNAEMDESQIDCLSIGDAEEYMSLFDEDDMAPGDNEGEKEDKVVMPCKNSNVSELDSLGMKNDDDDIVILEDPNDDGNDITIKEDPQYKQEDRANESHSAPKVNTSVSEKDSEKVHSASKVNTSLSEKNPESPLLVAEKNVKKSNIKDRLSYNYQEEHPPAPFVNAHPPFPRMNHPPSFFGMDHPSPFQGMDHPQPFHRMDHPPHFHGMDHWNYPEHKRYPYGILYPPASHGMALPQQDMPQMYGYNNPVPTNHQSFPQQYSQPTLSESTYITPVTEGTPFVNSGVVIQAAPKLNTLQVTPVTMETPSAGSGSVIQAAPKLNTLQVTPVTRESPSAGAGSIIQAAPKLNSNMTGTILLQNVTTDLDEATAKRIFEQMGDVTGFTWPKKDKAFKLVSIHYKNRRSAEKAERLLNHLKLFGEKSSVKLIGSDNKGVTYLFPEDYELVQSLHNIAGMFRSSNKYQETQKRIGESVPASSTSCTQNQELKNPDSQFKPPTVFKVTIKDFPENITHAGICEALSEVGAIEDISFVAGVLQLTFSGDPVFLEVLCDARFPYKKLTLTYEAPHSNRFMFSRSQMKKAKSLMENPLLKLMSTIASRLENELDEEMNIYTFKTRSCRSFNRCSEKNLCHKFHSEDDRRRCPILFKYSDQMCQEMEKYNKCSLKDKCPHAHSAVEVLFHFKNFRATMCPTKNGKTCNKVGRICYNVHSEKPEMLYNKKWENVFAEGLKSSLSYLAEAIKNLFMFNESEGVQVMLITPAPALASLYAKCISNLAVKCNQKVSELKGNAIEGGTTVVISSFENFQSLLNSQNKTKFKILDLSKLKALILDDGSAMLSSMTGPVADTVTKLCEEGVNFVITSYKWTTKRTVLAREKLRTHKEFLRVSEETSVPTDAKVSSKSYKNDLLERNELSKKKNDHKSEKEQSAKSKEREIEARRRPDSSKQERSREKASRSSRDSSSSTKHRKDTSFEPERYLDDVISSDPHTHKNTDSRMRKLFDEIFELSNRPRQKEYGSSSYIEDSHQPPSEVDTAFAIAKLELEKEFETELQLYIQSPEIHPDYEMKYSLFTEKYNEDFPDRFNMKRREKLWKLFWEEIMTTWLKRKYEPKRQTLHKEFLESKKNEKKNLRVNDIEKRESESRKRRSSSRNSSDSFEKCHKKSKVSDNIESKSLSYNDKSEKEERKKTKTLGKPLMIPDGTGGKFSLDETVSLLNLIVPSLGILGTTVEMLSKKIESCWSDLKQIQKIFEDQDSRLILKMVSDKAKHLSGTTGSEIHSAKLHLASIHGECILKYVSLLEKKFFGLNIDDIARATFSLSPATLIQIIKTELLSKGVDPSEENITKIFEAVSSAQFTMGMEMSSQSGTGSESKSQSKNDKSASQEKEVFNWKFNEAEKESGNSQIWLTKELDDLIKNLGKSKSSGSNTHNDDSVDSTSVKETRVDTVNTGQGFHSSKSYHPSNIGIDRAIKTSNTNVEPMYDMQMRENPYSRELRSNLQEREHPQSTELSHSAKSMGDFLANLLSRNDEKYRKSPVRERSLSEHGLTEFLSSFF